MAYSESHSVVLTKLSQRQLQEKALKNNPAALLASVNSRALTIRGWTLTQDAEPRKTVLYGKERTDQDYEYRYLLPMTLAYSREDGKQPEPNELNAILRTIAVRCEQPQQGRWTLTSVDGKPVELADTGAVEVTTETVGYADVDIPADWSNHFDHLYGLDSHITRILRALEAGKLSDWNNRYHIALQGPPGCGKSDICQSLKRALGPDAVLEFDATSTTAAGAIKELSEREILPRILLVEEIEKADEKALSFLLSVLDLRSEVRKTTARSTIVRDTKLFAIATVNDIGLFNRLQAGALASRFSNKIGFQRPGREQLTKILKREIAKINGDEAWIRPTLDYCETADITDPRQVSAICLCGRDMLLTGEYQKLLAETPTQDQELSK